jgi:hypothetical protein
MILRDCRDASRGSSLQATVILIQGLNGLFQIASGFSDTEEWLLFGVMSQVVARALHTSGGTAPGFCVSNMRTQNYQNLYLGAGSSKPPQLLSHSCIVRGKLSGVEACEQSSKISLNWRSPPIGSSPFETSIASSS